MNIHIEQLTNWDTAYEAALYTIGKHPVKTTTIDWVYNLTVSGHSPLETVIFMIEFTDLKKTVYDHLIRHTKGNPRMFCQSQRPDITGKPRPEKMSEYNVNCKWFISAWSLKAALLQRLCRKSELDTRAVANELVEKLKEYNQFGHAYARGIYDCTCAGKYGSCTELFGGCRK